MAQGGNSVLPNGTQLLGNGTITTPAGGVVNVLSSTGIPVVLAPNGTIATNGTVTLGTALPAIFPYAWVRFPAAAVSGGSAGLYFVTFTSTTVGQVYTAFIDPSSTAFVPYVPAALTNAVGSNSAYTQATSSDITLLNTTLAAGSLGPNGFLRKTVWTAQVNNANAKTVKIGYSGGLLISLNAASSLNAQAMLIFHNMGDESHQSLYPSTASFGTTSGAQTQGSLNTATAQSIVVTANSGVATDYICIMHNSDEVLYQP